MFIDNLIINIKLKENPSILGIDPKIEYLPEFIKNKFYKEYGVNVLGAVQAILYFSKKLIDATYDIIPVVKIQSAYFELYGAEGIAAFKEISDYAKTKGLIVIGDMKGNDIDSTASTYSSAYLGQTVLDDNNSISLFDFDSVTVNPYMGSDSITPFLVDCKKYSKGIFILAKTSNKSSCDFQDLKVGQRYVYEIVAQHINKWGIELIGKYGYSSVGAVVGATYPQEAKVLREIMPKTYFLVPGYGAQGGKAKDICSCFNKDGLGVIINSSRGLMYAYKSERWKEKYDEISFDAATRAEALRMRDEIKKVLSDK